MDFPDYSIHYSLSAAGIGDHESKIFKSFRINELQIVANVVLCMPYATMTI